MEVCIVGLDLAKNVFQVHGTDAEGHVLIRRQLRRAEVGKFFSELPPSVVGMEACATSHHWARLVAGFGHEVRLLPPAQVKPYVKRGKKNDAADAAAIAASVPDPSVFQSGRHFAAWLGLVPRQNSSGGKDRLGRITKMGDAYIRRLLVIGATGQVRHVGKRKPTDWLAGLLLRKPVRVASVALANKMARIAWAILSRGEVYRETLPLLAA